MTADCLPRDFFAGSTTASLISVSSALSDAWIFASVADAAARFGRESESGDATGVGLG
jgi:hypothetical protein